MAKNKSKEKKRLRAALGGVYSVDVVLGSYPREAASGTDAEALIKAREYREEYDKIRKSLASDPCDYEALLRLKSLLGEYKAFYVRRRKRVRHRRSKPRALLSALREMLPEDMTELLARTELAVYDKHFEEHPLLTRPPVSSLLGAKSNRNRLRGETLLDIYGSIYVSDSIKLRLEKELLENPKELYPAARSMRRRFIIHSGMTNTGKTYNAIEALKKAHTGAYLGPLRLLAFEIQENLLMSDVMCSLKTGEEEDIVRYATHISSTVELMNLYARYDVAVIDECQMIGSCHRGSAWTRAVLGVRADEIHLCTAPDAVGILVKLIEDCGDEYEIINYSRREPIIYDKSLDTGVEIEWENEEGEFRRPSCAERLKKIDLDKLQYGDALIAFSRADVLEISDILRRRGTDASIIYGSLPYGARKRQLERFLRHETQIIVATDAIGMGLNLPIRRVIFTAAHKFDGERYRLLYPSEVKQIAGRAGRIGIFDEGFVHSVEMPEYIKAATSAPINPIEKAYIDFDTAFVEIEYKLEDILKAWMDARMPFEMYEKIDINRTIMLLRGIARLCEEKGLKCGKETSYRLSNIVFDESVPQVYKKWLDYVGDYLTGADELEPPRIMRRGLDDLEISFKKVDLYYSFCCSMDYTPDMEWIRRTKSYIAEEINNRLRGGTRIKNTNKRRKRYD